MNRISLFILYKLGGVFLCSHSALFWQESVQMTVIELLKCLFD